MAIVIGIIKYIASLIADFATPTSLRSAILNLQNESGNTALHWAALNGHLQAVKILIAAGANSFVRNKAGHDAIYEAEINSKEDVVEWLLKEGNLDVEAADADDATLRDGDGRRDPNTKMRVSSTEESVSPAKIHEDDKFDEMEEKVERLNLG